jgi:hypothetical protein
LTEKVVSQVTFELEQIDQLLAAYADLWVRVQQQAPDLVEMTALASVLHSFYTGLENIFLSIVKGLESGVPTGTQWHRDLLVQMTQRLRTETASFPRKQLSAWLTIWASGIFIDTRTRSS